MGSATSSDVVGSCSDGSSDENITLGEVLGILWRRAAWIGLAALVGGVLAFFGASLLPPVFTARSLILPPQQQQSSAAAALSSLGALAGLAGGAAGGLKSPADQYVAFMQSRSVVDPMIDRFKLMQVYEAKFKDDARRTLAERTQINVGKKDGLISVEVDDEDPARAASIANAYVDGLRSITNTLAVSEAQQRRAFFEQQLTESRDRLTQAQITLQGSGFNPGALRAEPKAAAEGYARVRAELTAAEIKLSGMRRSLADSAPEVQQQVSLIQTLRTELLRLEQRQEPSPAQKQGDSDYVTKYREYKYQETLFELFARQYEVARVDESREGALIQVVDAATAPEKKSKPKRGLIAVLAALATGFVACLVVLFRSRYPGARPVGASIVQVR